jgi:hypothetical protein
LPEQYGLTGFPFFIRLTSYGCPQARHSYHFSHEFTSKTGSKNVLLNFRSMNGLDRRRSTSFFSRLNLCVFFPFKTRSRAFLHLSEHVSRIRPFAGCSSGSLHIQHRLSFVSPFCLRSDEYFAIVIPRFQPQYTNVCSIRIRPFLNLSIDHLYNSTGQVMFAVPDRLIA